MDMNSNNLSPIIIDPTKTNITLNTPNPVSIQPTINGTERINNNPIIIVPGVMGSRLFDKKGSLGNKYRQIWPPVVRPDSEEESNWTLMQLEELDIKNHLFIVDYAIDQCTGKRVKPSEMTYIAASARDSKSEGPREYGADDAYKELVNSVCDEFPEREVFFFSYDWRKGNDNTASELARFIYFLTTRVNVTTHEVISKKVDLICHSMGGLVASSLILGKATERSTYMLPEADLRATKDRIGKIITLGTPYEGSPNLLRAILTVKVMKPVLNQIFRLSGMSSKIKKGLCGVTQLTPTTSYITHIPQIKVVYKHKQGYMLDRTTYHEREDMTPEDYKHVCEKIFTESVPYSDIVTFQNSIQNGLLSTTNSYFGMGGNQKTLESSVLYEQSYYKGQNSKNDDYWEHIYAIDAFFEKKGDGTVPFLSANKINAIESSKLGSERVKYFYNTNHMDIVKKSDPVNWTIAILKHGKSDLGKNDPPAGDSHIDMRVACPVDVTITNGIQSIKSIDSNINIATDFGKMHFLGRDGEIKLSCLDMDNYTIQLQGTDTGTMDYSLRFFDADNAVIETRDLYNIPVTKDTLIITDTNMDEPTVLVDKKRPWEKHRATVTKNYRLTSSKIPEVVSEYKEFTADDAVDLYNNAEIIDDSKTIDLSKYDSLPFDVARAWLIFAENDNLTLSITSEQLIKNRKDDMEKISTVTTTLNEELVGDIMLKPTLYLTQSESQYIEFPMTIPKDVFVIDTGQLSPNNQNLNIEVSQSDIPLNMDDLHIYICSIYGAITQLDNEFFNISEKKYLSV